MSALWAAVIAAIVGPFVITWLQGRQRAEERREDWRRQDEVATRAEETARLLLVNNAAVAAQQRVANTKLEVIHTLVNSNMTAALQGELDSTRANLATLRELIGLRVAQGEEPDTETRAALAALEGKVGRLSANLQDRIDQTKVADAQIFVAKEKVHEPDP